MDHNSENQIQFAEERLRSAMLGSDVSVLNELISPDLIFTNHLGQVLTKEDDLTAHHSGVVKIKTLNPSEQKIRINEKIAIVSVKMHTAGSYAGTESEGHIRFTRIWALSSDNAWRIIAGHSSIVA